MAGDPAGAAQFRSPEDLRNFLSRAGRSNIRCSAGWTACRRLVSVFDQLVNCAH
jgi:hypothetical protein